MIQMILTESFGGFCSFSFIWNIRNGFKKVGLGVIVVWLDSEDWLEKKFNFCFMFDTLSREITEDHAVKLFDEYE